MRYKNRRLAMIEAAHDLFLQLGYDINMDEVASRAGVTKKTLYNHFGTKLSLLEAVLQQSGETFIQKVELLEGADLTETLTHYAEQYQLHSFTVEGIQFYKLTVADVSKYPDMAAAIYHVGIDRVVSALTAQLEKARVDGRIISTDPRAAAERFIGALTGLVRHRAYAGLGIDSEEARAIYLADTVDLFVKALTPEV